MHKRQKQFNPSGIKWPTEVDMLKKNYTTLFHAENWVFILATKRNPPNFSSLKFVPLWIFSDGTWNIHL